MIALERRNGRPLRIGHRGAAALAPENTLRSFCAAVEAGVDLIEFDVLALRSGELVIAHSNDLREVSHGAARGSVRRKTLEELRSVSPELPTLDDVLAFFAEEARDIGVHVDLKSASVAHQVVDAMRRFGLVERGFVSSFHGRALRAISAREPGLRTGISFPRDRLRMYGRRGSAPFVRGGLLGLRAITLQMARILLARSRASTLVLNHAVVSRAVVSWAHSRSVPVVAWTVDDPKDLARVVEAGVDAVVTNDPTIFVSTLESA